MSNSCKCGFTETQDFGNRGRLPAWDGTHVVTVSILDSLEEFSNSEYENILSDCLKHIRSVCGIDIKFIGWGQLHANIVIRSKRIDGPNGVLANAKLPPYQPGNPTKNFQCDINIDTGEQWARYDGRIQRMMDLFRVLLHELGHALGLFHNEHGDSLMSPSVSEHNRFGAYGVMQLDRRYGPPRLKPNPHPNPQPEPNPVDLCEEIFACVNSMEFRQGRFGGRLAKLVDLLNKISGLFSSENLELIKKILDCMDSLSPEEFEKKFQAVLRLAVKER